MTRPARPAPARSALPPARRLGLVVTLVAWLCATGTQWDVVQAVAWVRMFAENSRDLPVLAALERTFSPAARCSLCHAVSQAKQDEPGPAGTAGKSEAKIVFVHQAAESAIVTLSAVPAWPVADFTAAGTLRAAPPLPPPRA
ncbi:MAG: hypothetical protein B9S34_10640 [Opitutia bacterium Tous-C1TDCM]|nr:MAG: hypothetical protein B9S34_10640 [Opitutae bacterium Tous-C1TDCM]